MAGPLVVVDSNVIVAALVRDHLHHIASQALLKADPPIAIAVAAHSYAEAFTTLTRHGEHAPFRWSSSEAWAGMESIATVTRLVGLTPAASLAAVREFAASGGIGARIYDYLIARAAQAAGAEMLVTWNVGHFRGLIDGLDVRTPSELLAK